MTDHWDRVKSVFDAALSAGADHQDHVLSDLCADVPALRDEVRTLLEAHGWRGFVDELAERLAEGDGAWPADISVPVRIGRYEVIEKIGQGGMAVVYKGHDSQLDRLVALKLLSPARGLDHERRRRLMIEARAAAALDHPSIATIYEVGETEDGRVFLAMAFYEGETLQARMARGPLPVAESVRIAHQIASALAAAHARGITHRDLKPANVLLTRSGAVKLLDFGIAKMPGVDETRSGELLGTFAYMSPEQLRGEAVDARADVWALGLVLYEMLTGERASAAGLRAILAGDPAPLPSSRRMDIPRQLDRIVERALRPALDERYRDGSALTAALERWAEHDEAGSGDSARTVRLPAPVTSFFGREREIEGITRRLTGVRLLTLTGPGGTGKTRLALRIASSLRDRYEDGVAFVSLEAISDPDLVCSEIARVLGIPECPAVSAVDALASFLRSRRMLLVVDNFEHVVRAAPAVARLMADCAGLHLLVTSRVPLKISGEYEYPVPPLPHPQARAAVTAADLDAYPATALFLDRARAVCPDFAGDGDQAGAIAEVCVRLDGLPLAIELAAARVKLFSPRAMLARLDRRFELLSAGGRDRPARHQSLRQALAWSYDLLTAAEQTLLRRLSVFVGGCSLEDMAALSRALGSGDGDVIDGCTALIDHSLVVRKDGPDGLPRLRMLETIREFARECLETSGEAHLASRTHAGLFLTLAEQSEPHLTGPDQAAWFDRLEVEHDNLRAALSWAQNDDRDIALRLGSVLWRFWAARGHLREGRERLEQLLAMPGVEQPTLLRARVLNGAATLIHETSDFRGARPLIEESFAIARDQGDRPLTALVLNNLAWLLVWIGENATAGALCEEALRLNRELAHPRGIAIALHNLAYFAQFRGDYDRACALHGESLDWRRAQGDRRGAAFAMTDLASAEIKRGALDRASRLLDEARTTLEGLHDRQLVAWALTTQGLLEHAAGRSAGAFDRFEAGIELFRAVGNVFGLAFSLIGDAHVALDQGVRERALDDLDEALPLLRRTGISYGLGDGLRARARLAAVEGDHEGARVFYTEALEPYTCLGDQQAIQECHEAVARLANP